jgi:hypothetical protein
VAEWGGRRVGGRLEQGGRNPVREQKLSGGFPTLAWAHELRPPRVAPWDCSQRPYTRPFEASSQIGGIRVGGLVSWCLRALGFAVSEADAVEPFMTSSQSHIVSSALL